MSPLRKVISIQVYPPPTPPLKRDGCRAPIDISKIYRHLLELPAPFHAGRERSGVGRIWVNYAHESFFGVDSVFNLNVIKLLFIYKCKLQC